MTEEIEVICSQCSFPTVTIMDDSGKTVVEFHEEPGPKTEEEALAGGWTDTGLGLLCPKCTVKYKADAAREQEEGVESGPGTERVPEIRTAVGATTFGGMLRAMHPNVSNLTISLFANLLDQHEMSKSDAVVEYEKLRFPEPTTELQAREFLAVAETVKNALVKK